MASSGPGIPSFHACAPLVQRVKVDYYSTLAMFIRENFEKDLEMFSTDLSNARQMGDMELRLDSWSIR